MNIQETAAHLQTLNQPFDVLIVKNGAEQELYKELPPTNVEALLNDVVNSHNPERLIIQERRKNGTVNLKTHRQEVALQAPAAPQYPQAGLAGVSYPVVQQPVSVPADFKDYMISDLKKKAEKWEQKAEKLEKENYDLKKERDDLQLELKTKDKEFDLAQKEQQLEQTNGLSGIIETVSANPALANIAAMAIGRLMGIDASQLEGGDVPAIGSAPADAPDVPDVNKKIAGFVADWIHKADEQTAVSFYELMKQLAAAPELITEYLNELKEQGNG